MKVSKLSKLSKLSKTIKRQLNMHNNMKTKGLTVSEQELELQLNDMEEGSSWHGYTVKDLTPWLEKYITQTNSDISYSCSRDGQKGYILNLYVVSTGDTQMGDDPKGGDVKGDAPDLPKGVNHSERFEDMWRESWVETAQYVSPSPSPSINVTAVPNVGVEFQEAIDILDVLYTSPITTPIVSLRKANVKKMEEHLNDLEYDLLHSFTTSNSEVLAVMGKIIGNNLDYVFFDGTVYTVYFTSPQPPTPKHTGRARIIEAIAVGNMVFLSLEGLNDYVKVRSFMTKEKAYDLTDSMNNTLGFKNIVAYYDFEQGNSEGK